MGTLREFLVVPCELFLKPERPGKYCRPITDSTERDRQGQRREEGFLWIREAGIRVL
jgi:hypothetical protein